MASKGIKWETKPELLEWKSIATEKQRFYYEFYRKRRWEIYEEPEQPYLKLKIGYALFGPPVNVKDSKFTVENLYSPTQKKKIEEVFNAMKKVNKGDKNIIAGFLFFIATIDNKYTEFPVFRVLIRTQEDGTETCNFVDSFGYVYKNWDKFLSTNIIPYCIYCYPKEGFYNCNESGDLELDFGYCPQRYSILSGVVSAVGTVGSAVGTVLPVGGTAQNELLPIPLISVVKGIQERNKFTWIPVTTANGSADLYAVHFTQALAESTQKTKNIPLIICDSLEEGYINITWYAVINHISNVIFNSNKTTPMHVAQVMMSALFFCHAVPSWEITKTIIKEIRSDKNKRTLNNLKHCKKVALENSLELKGKKTSNPIIEGLKFVDDRLGLINEIIETTFQTHFMIPDESGKYYTLSALLENIGTSTESKKFADIITNYCLVLENIIRNCKNCSKVKETQGKFLGTLNKKYNIVEDEVKAQKQTDTTEVNSMTPIKNELNKNDNLTTTKENNLELNVTNSSESNEISSPVSKEILNNDTNTPEKLKNQEKVASSDWLLVNVFNTLASPLVTPKKQQEKGEASPAKEITVCIGLQDTPKNKHLGNSDSLQNYEETPTKAKTKPIQDEENIKLFENNNIQEVLNEIKKNLGEYSQNINTPDKKVYIKGMSPNNLNINASEQMNEGKESNVAVSLNGKNFTVTRDYIPDKELEPLQYFQEYVQAELNNTSPLHYGFENGNEGWQFLLPEEVCGVKVVKINIVERSSEEKKEVININYY